VKLDNPSDWQLLVELTAQEQAAKRAMAGDRGDGQGANQTPAWTDQQQANAQAATSHSDTASSSSTKTEGKKKGK
jgi:hypothetical protein